MARYKKISEEEKHARKLEGQKRWRARQKELKNSSDISSYARISDALVYLRKAYTLYPEHANKRDTLPTSGKMFLLLAIRTLEGKT